MSNNAFAAIVVLAVAAYFTVKVIVTSRRPTAPQDRTAEILAELHALRDTLTREAHRNGFDTPDRERV